MLKKTLRLMVLSIFLCGSIFASSVHEADRAVRKEVIDSLKARVHQYKLANGMTVICVPATNTNIATVGAFVRVGSAHEGSDEWGLAHILEHMVFKGTKTRGEGELKRLAEHFGMRIGSDYNAHTTYDYTSYYFNTDNKNWRVFADIIADSTKNLLVKPEALDSELAAICQEIKMSGSDLDTLLFDGFLPMNHPYGHRIIGYKEQVLSYTAPQVMKFYEQHYLPEKTTFFVCGNVDPNDVAAYAQEIFSDFTRAAVDPVVTKCVSKDPFYAGFSTVNKTIYHTQQHRVGAYAWYIPGSSSVDSLAFDYLAKALRLRLKDTWVNKQGYCFDVGHSMVQLERAGLFFFYYVPRRNSYNVDYDALITTELLDIIKNGLTDAEFTGPYQDRTFELVACAENPVALVANFVSNPQSSQDVASQFFSTEELLQQITKEDIQRVAYEYLRPFCMSKLTMLPLPSEELNSWSALQTRVSLHESVLLQARQRTDSPDLSTQGDMTLLPNRIVLDPITLGDHETFTLSNGITVYWQRDTTSPRRVCGLVLKDVEEADLAHQVAGKLFARQVMPDLLLQGTVDYSAKEFEDVLRVSGVSLQATDNILKVTALKNNFEEGLRLMRHVLDDPLLPEEIFERKKQEFVQQLVLSRNDPSYCLKEYLAKTLYAQYPWQFTEEKVIQHLQAVSLADVRERLSLMRDPARIALVMCGDFDKDEARVIAERYFSSLNRSATLAVKSVTVPGVPTASVSGHIEVPVEQSTIFAVRVGCNTGSPDSPALAIISSYLNKKLFEIRERTGLFYSSGASVTRGTKRLPGIIYFSAQLTPQNVSAVVQEMQIIVQGLFDYGLDGEVFAALKSERSHSRGTYFNTADTVASVFMSAICSGLSLDADEVFDKQVDDVTLDQVNSVIREYFNPLTWSFITIGKTQ